MLPETLKHLEDIRDAASFIIDSLAGKNLNDYRGNRLLRQAVERNFEIIGEALNRVKRIDPETLRLLGDVGRIVAFRNILVHGYDAVDDEIVWLIAQNNLPVLLKAVTILLTEND